MEPKNEAFDFSRTAVAIADGRPVDLSDYDVRQHISIIDSFRSEFVEYIVTHGLTSLVTRECLSEALLARGASRPYIEALLQICARVRP